MDQIRDLLLYKEKMMKEYVVEITEVLQHQETVKAHSKNEAINAVRAVSYTHLTLPTKRIV